MKTCFTGLLLLTSLLLLSACGQKGPLYLESKAAPKAAVAEVEKNTATDKKESDQKSEKKD